ncbi:hypothetical protein PGT21_017882 [Puccinia graminis f. sp. tritici]|nr:hypothetical protein PGT21_017882 [Puccinia graminis f. sp. tritici]KAA1092067.1 hypothetical protein PGTUg99_011369 [Puccinia graminis f. sp. tritici]
MSQLNVGHVEAQSRSQGKKSESRQEVDVVKERSRCRRGKKSKSSRQEVGVVEARSRSR